MMRIGAIHLSSSKGKKVQMSAQPYRGAPIRTYPTPEIENEYWVMKSLIPNRTITIL